MHVYPLTKLSIIFFTTGFDAGALKRGERRQAGNVDRYMCIGYNIIPIASRVGDKEKQLYEFVLAKDCVSIKGLFT